MYAYRVPAWELDRAHLGHVEELEQPVLGEGHQLSGVCWIQEPAQEPRIKHLGGTLFQFNTNKEIIKDPAVFRIRAIHKFLGLSDPDPSIIKQNSKKNLFYFYSTVLWLLYDFLWRMMYSELNIPSKK